MKSLMLLALLAIAVPASGQVQKPSTASPASLAGQWMSAPLEAELTTEFHRSVYGAGARSVRTVAMTLEPSGAGRLTVTSRVRDRRGRVVPGTEETDEVRFSVGDLVEEPGRQPYFTSRVERAERRFADDPASTIPRDGVRLALYASAASAGTLEIRFDTPEGTGSFWETLRRARTRAATPR